MQKIQAFPAEKYQPESLCIFLHSTGNITQVRKETLRTVPKAGRFGCSAVAEFGNGKSRYSGYRRKTGQDTR